MGTGDLAAPETELAAGGGLKLPTTAPAMAATAPTVAPNLVAFVWAESLWRNSAFSTTRYFAVPGLHVESSSAICTNDMARSCFALGMS